VSAGGRTPDHRRFEFGPHILLMGPNGFVSLPSSCDATE
jgi:hypothetical protein